VTAGAAGRGRPRSEDAEAVRSAILSADPALSSAAVARQLAAAGTRVSAQYVRQVRATAGEQRTAGGQPSGAIAYSARSCSARARALLDQVLADATAAGLEPEDYLRAARR
jgi:hypothetical protein